MVAVKCLNTSKIKVSGGRERKKSGTCGGRSLKVYTETDEAKVQNKDRVDSETKRKSNPVKAKTSDIRANCQKEVLYKLEKIHGENINSAQTKVGRKVLADISNSRSNFQKSETSDGSRPGNSRSSFQKSGTFDGSRPGKGKMERMPYLQRASVGTGGRNASSSSSKLSTGKARTRSETVDGRHSQTLGRVGTKDLKVFRGTRTTRLQDQGTIGDVTRKPARSYRPPQRKSLPNINHVDEADTCDLKKGNLENNVKNKEKYRFSVKPKFATTVVPQVSNARWRNRNSEGSIRMASEVQPTVEGHRISRRSAKPTVKTTFGIPRPQRVSRNTSVFTKSTSSTSVFAKKKEAASRSSCSKHVESVTSEQDVPSACNSNLVTLNVTRKGQPGRRKSYTSMLIASSKVYNVIANHGNVPKEALLPNIYDDCNQLEVAEYVDEIYRHYWVTEAHNQSLKNYMEIQTDITPQMRGILINWLVEVHLKFDLMQETLYLMVTLLDYYLSIVTVKKNEMQLVGLTSLLLASKYEDFWHPKVMELIGISAETYTRDQMLAMETTILKKLNFRLNLPTPYVFMLRFLRAAQAGKEFERLAFFLIELCLVEYDALHFKPSMLCASAIYVARCTLHLLPAWTPLLCKHSHYEEVQIRDCGEMILRVHQAARTAVLKVTYDKYTSADNCRVALIAPLGKLPPMNNAVKRT